MAGLAIDLDDKVTGLDTGLAGRGVVDRRDNREVVLLDLVVILDVARITRG